MVNITKETESYINNHPFIKQGIENNIINYSKLARMISKEKEINNFDAILVACRRYFDRLNRSKFSFPIMEVLKNSKLSIRSNIVVIILEPDIKFKTILELQKEIDSKNEIMHVVRGSNAITLITTDDFLKKIENTFKEDILKISKNLVEIVLKSSAKLEMIPGVMGHICSILGENDVNIIETSSCWTDTIIVIKKEHLAKTMELFDFKVEE
jgi:hypothetical protein